MRKRVSYKDRYFCRKLQVNVVQKLVNCGEKQKDICDGCKYKVTK